MDIWKNISGIASGKCRGPGAAMVSRQDTSGAEHSE